MKVNKILCSVMGIACAVSCWVGMSGFTTASAAENESCSHEYETRVVDPTCTAMGYTIYDCVKCGDTYNDNYVEATGHTFSDVVISPTCTHKGYTAHYCTVCGNEYMDSYIEALGHDYVKDEKSPTCTEGGTAVYTCSNCGDVVEIELEATGHSYVDEVVKATCVAYGYTKHTCESCGNSYVTDYIKPLGHDYEVSYVVADADTLGYTKYQCNNCEYGYITDYVTSGDNGYLDIIEDDKKGEDSGAEQPVLPNEPVEDEKEPTETETPDDKGDSEEAHTHEYILFYGIDESAKVIQLGYSCECGEQYADELKTVFADNNGNVTLVPVENGVVNYSALYGNFNVIVMDSQGNTLTTFDLSNVNVEEVKPAEPDNAEEVVKPVTPGNTEVEVTPTSPDDEQESETPNTSEDNDNSAEQETITVTETKKGQNFGLILGVGIAMLVIAAGLITTLIVIKKKNKNKKK